MQKLLTHNRKSQVSVGIGERNLFSSLRDDQRRLSFYFSPEKALPSWEMLLSAQLSNDHFGLIHIFSYLPLVSDRNVEQNRPLSLVPRLVPLAVFTRRENCIFAPCS